MQTIKEEDQSLTKLKTAQLKHSPFSPSPHHIMASPIKAIPATIPTNIPFAPNFKLMQTAEEASAGKSLLSPLSLSSPPAPSPAFVLSVFGDAPLALDGAGAGASLGSTRSRGRSTLSTWYMASLLSV